MGSKLFSILLKEAMRIARSGSGRDERLGQICALLKCKVPNCDWVGFYFASDASKELILGPFAGEPTEHTRIQYGKGICGQTVLRKKTFVVQDVSKESNYLSCGSAVKSEIVVPVFKGGAFVAELDIDSHTLSPFSREDRKFLEEISRIVSVLF